MKSLLILSLSLWSFGAAAQLKAPEFWYGLRESTPQQKTLNLDFLAATPAVAYDESLNFHPQLNLYNEAAALTDLFGTHGSQLCAPVAITHGITYIRYPAGYSSLMAVPDMDRDGTADTYRDKMRYFFQTCGTDKENGTLYRSAIRCIREYVEKSGYKSYVYMVGAHANEAPPGVNLPVMQHVLNVEDIRTYVGHRLMVLMGVGWYAYNPTTKTYTRQGGHFFNVYGYDWMRSWGQGKIVIKAVNSWVNYTGRQPAQMYDDVEMVKLPNDGTQYPVETGYELHGNGFNFQQKALVEDIFVALPLAP